MVCSRAPFPCFPNLYVLLFFSVVGADETSELLSPKSQAPTQINPDANQKPNPKTAEVQKEIDAVTNAMHQNLEAIAERGERMNNLQDKSGASSSVHLLYSNLPLWRDIEWEVGMEEMADESR